MIEMKILANRDEWLRDFRKEIANGRKRGAKQ